MGDLDHNGDGLVDMRIDGTAQGVGELRAEADGLGGRLTAAFDEINELTGKLGKGGKMSDQFMTEYRNWRDGAEGLDKGVNDVPVNYRKIADSGDAAVGTYRAAEQNASGQFRS
jgi:hypothetical protein